MNLFFMLTMVSGLYAVSNDKKHLKIGMLIGIPTLVASWIVLLLSDVFLSSIVLVFWIFFDSIIAYDILKHILEKKEVTLDLIFGAVSVYLLLGIIFGLAYLFIEQVSPGSFAAAQSINPDGVFQLPDLMYYSFVTLGTLGFGDILPVSQVARSLSIIEAIFGIFYIAVLVGVLVSGFVNQNNKKK